MACSFEVSYTIKRCSSEDLAHPASALTEGGKWSPLSTSTSAWVDLEFGTEFSIHSVSFTASACTSVKILLCSKRGERGSWFAGTKAPQDWDVQVSSVEVFDGRLPTTSECRLQLMCRSSGTARLAAIASQGQWTGLRLVLSPCPSADADTFYVRRLEVNRQPSAVEQERIRTARAAQLASMPPPVASSGPAASLYHPPRPSQRPELPGPFRSTEDAASAPVAASVSSNGARATASGGGGLATVRPLPRLVPRAQRPPAADPSKRQRRASPSKPLPTPVHTTVGTPVVGTSSLTPVTAPTGEPPLCEKHANPSRAAFVKRAGKHFGRAVWVCSLQSPGGCGFVGWRTHFEAATPGSGSRSSGGGGRSSGKALAATAATIASILGTPTDAMEPPLATPPTANVSAAAAATETDVAGGSMPRGTEPTAAPPLPALQGLSQLPCAPVGWRKRGRHESTPTVARPRAAAVQRRKSILGRSESAITPVNQSSWDFNADIDGEEKDDEDEAEEEAEEEEAEGSDAMRLEDATRATGAGAHELPTTPGGGSIACLELINSENGVMVDGDVEEEESLPRIIELVGVSVLLGRGEAADVRLDSVRLPRMVSREHAELQLDPLTGNWRVRDLGGGHTARHNGTAVNGVPLEKGASLMLRNGDELRLGRTQSDVRYAFVLHDEDAVGNSGSSPQL